MTVKDELNGLFNRLECALADAQQALSEIEDVMYDLTLDLDSDVVDEVLEGVPSDVADLFYSTNYSDVDTTIGLVREEYPNVALYNHQDEYEQALDKLIELAESA